MLEARGVTFRYRGRRRRPVLDDLDWAVRPGERTLLLGPNGAGKSTLLKLLCGYTPPSSGRITCAGSSRPKDLHRHVAWMPQDIRPVRGLQVLEQVEYAAWLSGASRYEAHGRAVEAVDMVRLGDQSKDRSDSLSGGQTRRLGLAQALVRKAEVLLLDEPTAGLDPAQVSTFREVLSGVRAPGGVVVSTHQVAELGDDVDRIAVLVDGAIRFDGTTEEFRAHGRRLGVDSDAVADIFGSIVKGGLH